MRARGPFWLEPGPTWGVLPRHLWASPGAAAAQSRPHGPHKGQKTKFWGIFKTHPQTSHTPQGSQKVSRTPLIATTRPYSAPETPKKPFWAHFALPGPRGPGRPRERRCTAQPGRAPSPADPCGRVCAAAAPGEAHRCRGGAPQVGPGSSQNGPRARVARCARADQPGAKG